MNQNLTQTLSLQQTASDPENSCWVFASAGSGKTKILTDRVLRLLLNDVKPNKILCLTFTKSGAAEMQQRINSRLASWVLKNEKELEKELQELGGQPTNREEIKKARTLFGKILDDENKIKIQTIHAFCQTFIKIFPFEAGISPNFEIIEEKQEKFLIKQAQKEIFKQAHHDLELKNLISKINSRLSEESFGELLSQLLNKKNYLEVNKEKIFKFFNITEKSEDEICHNFYQEISQAELLQLLLALENSGKRDFESYLKIKKFLQNPTAKNFYFYKSAFFTKENEERKFTKKILENIDLEIIRKKLCEEIADFSDQLFSLTICHDTSYLLDVARKILQEYSKLKKQNSFLDYDDLINLTNKLLENPEHRDWIKLKMDGSFDDILIDESQDTNHQQWNIVKALCEDFFSGFSASKENRSIFIVGDEKQSIYSFQGAEPNISEEIFSYFQEKLHNKLRKIELNNSFRSLSEVLNAVDKVFAEENRKKSISKISIFQDHKPIREGLGKVEIWPQFFDEKEKITPWQIDFNIEKKPNGKEILAEIIAKKIKSRVNNKEVLPGRKDPLRYSDFMVLLRNRTNGFDKSLINFFHKYQIPFSSLSKIKFSDNLMIQDLLAAAKFALLQEDDLNLACLLKSPFFAISEEKLLEICLIKNRDKTSVYKALGKNELLEEIITNARNLNAFEFFYNLLEKNNNRQKIIAYFGIESAEILDKFCLAVLEFCNNFSPNLQRFLDFVEKFDFEISLSGAEEDAVKIATVHAAKGLQAPVVLMPDCCYNFSQMPSTKEKIIWLENFPVYLASKSKQNKILEKYQNEKLLQAKDEYLRLLYVAMTRAEDELYISGFGNSDDKDSWYQIIYETVGNVVLMEELSNRYIVSGDEEKRNDNKENSENIFTESLPHSMTVRHSLHFQLKKTITQSQLRGKLIHKILEIFGKNYHQEKSWLLQIAQNLIANSAFLSEKEKKLTSDEVNNFLCSELFAEIFSDEIKCETEIISNGNIYRIDLMKITKNEVLIIDYKSDENAPDKIPQEYQKQISLYCELVKNIFSDKKITGAILWLKNLQLKLVQTI